MEKKPSMSYVVGWWAGKLQLDWFAVTEDRRIQKAVPDLDYTEFVEGKTDSLKEDTEKQLESLVKMLPGAYSTV